MENEDAYLKKLRATAKEYEYVTQEHGYDYVPPSQYVPSHSIDESDDDEYHTEAVVVMIPGSDISGSLGDDMYGMRDPYRRPQAPLPIPLPPPAREKRSHRGPVEMPYRRQATEKAYPRETEKPYPREPKEKSRREPMENSFRREAPEKPYSRERKHEIFRQSETETDQNDFNDANLGIKRVPTAFSYNSDDSAENFLEEKYSGSRYATGREDVVDEYERPRARNDERRSPAKMGWGDSITGFNEHWRKKRADIAEEEHSVAYKKSGTGLEDFESRLDHRNRRGDHNRETTQPQGRSHNRERGRHPRARSNSLEREDDEDGFHGSERRRNPSKQRHYGGEGNYASHPESRDDYGTSRFSPKRSEGKKSRGILGRIRGSVRGKKGRGVLVETDIFESRDKQHCQNREERPRGKVALFERPPPSTRSDVSYEYSSGERSPYRYEDYDRPSRERLPASPQEYEPPRRRSGREPQYHYESPREDDDWDHPTTRSSSPANVPRTRSSSSAVPFNSFRVPTPPLRFNPDHRQRPVPMAQSMAKHYDRAHQQQVRGGSGNRIPEVRQGRPKNMIPHKQGLQRPKHGKDPTQRYGDPHVGCY
jgi:hypothetical protein